MPVVGQTLFNGATVYSPWFMREKKATAAIFLAYVIDAGSGGIVTIDVFHRNSEDTNTGGAALGNVVTNQGSSSTVQHSNITGLKEMVRLKYTVGGDTGGWVHLAVPSPIFYTQKT